MHKLSASSVITIKSIITMKSFTTLAAALMVASSVSGHYIFQQLSTSATQYPVYQYIRKNSNYNSPVTDLASDDLRCNVGASGTGTSTVAVAAGSNFTFTTDTAVYHQGAVSVYMSKAPAAAAAYDGSGDWFKIHDEGPVFSGGQATWPTQRQVFTYAIPSCVPAGDYLLRVQQLAVHNPGGLPQVRESLVQTWTETYHGWKDLWH